MRLLKIPFFAKSHLSRYHTDPETGVIIPQHLRERVVEYAADHTMEEVQIFFYPFPLLDLIIVSADSCKVQDGSSHSHSLGETGKLPSRL